MRSAARPLVLVRMELNAAVCIIVLTPVSSKPTTIEPSPKSAPPRSAS